MMEMQIGIKKPGEFAKMQSPGEGDLMKFFGAAAPQYRRFVPVKGGSGVPTPARLTRGTNEPKGEIWATGRILLLLNRQFGSNKFLPNDIQILK